MDKSWRYESDSKQWYLKVAEQKLYTCLKTDAKLESLILIP